MEEQTRTNILRIIDKAILSVKVNDVKVLKDLSNETLHDASTLQDRHSITVAVLIYSLSKIFEREFHYGQFKGWDNFSVDCLKNLETAKKYLESDDEDGFDDTLSNFMKILSKLDNKLKQYVQDVFAAAKINKASRIYEHGISIGRTAELLGVSRYELMSYVGGTYIADVEANLTLSAKERLKIARGLFE